MFVALVMVLVAPDVFLKTQVQGSTIQVKQWLRSVGIL